MKYKYILFFIILLTSCQQKREVSTSFYYWRTVYKQNKVENQFLDRFQSKKLYLRIMDVDVDLNQRTVPVAPISFTDSISKRLEIVPVVFIVNDALKSQNEIQITELAHHILAFVKAKILQSGQKDYKELQIDCDWTASTRTKYFMLLSKLKKLNKSIKLSSTLRLHQLKNQERNGIPPVDKVLLMCYNMGNLRQYGTQNSILNVDELQKYVGKNLAFYPMDIDVALPLFSWSVVFRNQRYAGISKRIKLRDLQNTSIFDQKNDGLYVAKMDLAQFGLLRNDVVRFEESQVEHIKKSAEYLSSFLSKKPINLIYYHLDENLLKNYEINQLEEISHMLR